MLVGNGTSAGTLVRYVGRPLLLLFALDVVVAVAYVFAGWKWVALPDIPLSIFGGVIGVIAGFRNTSAYSRWWEARTIWGGIVNNSRSFARELLSLKFSEDDREPGSDLCPSKRALVLDQVAYVHALRHHMRGTSPWADLADYFTEEEIACFKRQANVPLAIQLRMSSIIARWLRVGRIDSVQWVCLDKTLSNLMDCQGASERIKNTPMPRLYDYFLRRFIEMYCVLLPLGMVANLGLLTPIGSTLIGFIFLALDQIGRDLEAPFENRPYDVALTSITRGIETNLKQMIGEARLPDAVIPIDGVLW
jgi:putative membrane protein